ncbi:PD-(D/E)XK nuclease family protein [Caldanaerobius polysaccharolyticus]|uniref:PD-(D/E)XK nuclease family protein n=1 Tax=Caldanaerobius polysaccharolyticus TaxID=44256 RepID=UPI00047E736B|nr:PD-(D/E)XK nuclease family protein [Caldanaerobius polysaccharolyticus]
MPVFELHASQITTYQTCPRMYRYQYVEHLVPKVTSPKLFLGRAGHAALAAYYSGKDALAAYEADINQQLAQIEPYASPEEWDEFQSQAELGRKLIEAYVPWARANDTFRVLAVEQSFVVPIWGEKRRISNAYYVGTFDGIAEDIYGNIWLMEHKFYKSVVSETVLRLDSQAGYYLMAASQLYPDRKVVGVIYTIIRKVDPVRARGGIIHRTRVLRNQHEIEGLRYRLYRIYRQIKTDKLFIPAPGFHCGWKCPYRELCVAEEDGSDVEGIKDMLFTTGEPAPILDEEAV